VVEGKEVKNVHGIPGEPGKIKEDTADSPVEGGGEDIAARTSSSDSSSRCTDIRAYTSGRKARGTGDRLSVGVLAGEAATCPPAPPLPLTFCP